jgi:hypothetical protein
VKNTGYLKDLWGILEGVIIVLFKGSRKGLPSKNNCNNYPSRVLKGFHEKTSKNYQKKVKNTGYWKDP